MTELYSKEELPQAEKKLKFYNLLLAIIIIAWFIVNAIVFYLKQTIEWGSSTTIHQLVATITTIIAACAFTFVFELPRRMCKGYIKIYSMVENCEPIFEEGVFLGVDSEQSIRYDVEFHEMLFYLGVNQKGREIIGRAIVEEERDISDMEIGDKIKYSTCGNIFCSYEIIEKNSMEEEKIDVLMTRMQQHIGMDKVMIADKPKRRRKRA